jgi:hypothetical protein
MVFLHIDPKSYENDEGKEMDMLNDIIKGHNNKVFILYYMEGCGPCNATKPEWAKIKNVLGHLEHNKNIAIVDIDQLLSDKIKGQHSPSGFPSMRFITHGGKTVENFEDSNIDKKDRTIDCFVDWIKTKTNDEDMKGGSMRKTKKTRKMRKTRKNIKGGKWSQKYKRSINCKRPRGFSQRQHCKYGRKN